MPVIAPQSYENQPAGGALENAAEEILNGIFCHYEPPTSTKAQKKAARAVKDQPIKFLYEGQKTKPKLRKKKIGTPSSQVSEAESDFDDELETEVGDYDDETSVGEEDIENFEPDTPGTKGGIKWRDEESKRIEEEKSRNAKAWSQCITIPCFTAVDGQVDEIPGGLEDIQDENDAPHEPTPTHAPTPTKSALKRIDDSMKVLYDDEGNPNTTPRSPGSIKNHIFFRNGTNSPRAPKDNPRTPPPKALNLPNPPSAPPSPAVRAPIVPDNQKVPVAGSSGITEYDFATSLANQNAPRVKQIGLLPGSPGITDELGGPQIIRLAKVGRKVKTPARVQTTMPTTPEAWAAVDPAASPARSFIAKSPKQYTVPPPVNAKPEVNAASPARSYIAKSPKQYMAPVSLPVNAKPEVSAKLDSAEPEISEEQTKSVFELVQVLNKSGFNPGRRFNRGYNAKSFKNQRRSLNTPSTKHHGYATANDNRGPLEREAKPSFGGNIRRVSAPAPLVTSIPSPGGARLTNYDRHMALNTEFKQHLEMNRDPSPRKIKVRQFEDQLRGKAALPPTPRRRAEEEPEPGPRPTPTAQKPPKHFVPSNVGRGGARANTGPYKPVTNRALKKDRQEGERRPRSPPANSGTYTPASNGALRKDRQEEERKVETRQKKKEEGAEAPRERSVKRSSGRTESRKQQREQQQQPRSSSKKERKGFMSGIKKGLGKLKTVVNDIDSQRMQETPASATSNNKRSGGSSRGGSGGRQVRMA